MPKPSDSVVFVGRATPAVMAATAKRIIRVKETIFCDSDVFVDWTSNTLLGSIYGAKTSDALSLSSLVQPFIFPAIESWHSPATVRQKTYGVICPELMILNQQCVKKPNAREIVRRIVGENVCDWHHCDRSPSVTRSVIVGGIDVSPLVHVTPLSWHGNVWKDFIW